MRVVVMKLIAYHDKCRLQKKLIGTTMTVMQQQLRKRNHIAPTSLNPSLLNELNIPRKYTVYCPQPSKGVFILLYVNNLYLCM